MDHQLIIFISFFTIITTITMVVMFSNYRMKEREKREERERRLQLDKENYQLREEMEKFKKEFQIKLDEVYSSMSESRKRFEDQIYESSSYFTRDKDSFYDANRVLLDTKENHELHINKKLPDFSFFEGMAINLSDIQVNDNMVACLMPFNSKFDHLKYAIADACFQCNYFFRRSDDEYVKNNNDLRKKIVQMILEAKVVVAVLDGRNPNVYYEIGIAQSMGKLVLMVVNMKNDAAINVSSNQLITYDTPQDLREKLVRTLKAIRFEQ